MLPELSQVLEAGNWGNTAFLESPIIKLINPKDFKAVESEEFLDPKYTPLLSAAYTYVKKKKDF